MMALVVEAIMGLGSAVLLYPLCTMYKRRAHTSNHTETRKRRARARIKGPYFVPMVRIHGGGLGLLGFVGQGLESAGE